MSNRGTAPGAGGREPRPAEIISGGGPRSSSYDSWTIACPDCGLEGGDQTTFNMSLADECFCPACGGVFVLEDPDDDEDESEDDEP